MSNIKKVFHGVDMRGNVLRNASFEDNSIPRSKIIGLGSGEGTGSIAPRAIVTLNRGTGQAATGQAAILLRVVCNRPCRIRIYSTAAARLADTPRNEATPPPAGVGLLLEFIAVDGFLSAPLAPAVTAYNLESPPTSFIYYNVESMDVEATVQLTYLTLES